MTAGTSDPRDSTRPPDGQDRLDSWKEIAAFLEREVRTIQRWEKTEGLPVHRHHHAKLGSVYAFKSELFAWKESRRAEMDRAQASQAAFGAESAKTSTSLGKLAAVSGLAVLASIFAIGLYSIWIVFLSPWFQPTDRIRLVVLPFENFSDPKEEYLADGMTEELGARLGRLNPSRLGVIARTSAMQYKRTSKSIAEIGRELDVDYVLEGSVRREGDKTRVTAQLIQVNDQTRLWAESVEMDLASVFRVWDEVAGQIGARLAIELLSDPAALSRTASINPEANDAYLRGRFLLNKRTPADIRGAMSHFERSLEADASHARAYAGLADAYALLGSTGYDVLPPAKAMPKAKEAASKALSLNPRLAQAHASLAYATMVYDWDWDRAEERFQQAISLDPRSAEARHWYAYLLSATDRSPEAFEQIRIALELDPVSLSVNAAMAWHLYFAGRYAEAVVQLQRTLELEPDFPLAHFELGMVYLEQGRALEAVSELERAARLGEDAPLHVAALGTAYARAGDAEKARETLLSVQGLASNRFVPALYFAWLHLSLGEREQAIEALEQAYRERSDYLLYLSVDPAFRELRDEPRFGNLVKKLGLPRPRG